jgi:hypothetical protein
LKTDKENIRVVHVQELQTLLAEFEKAKNFLKKEIAALNHALEQAALKYINREPRPVDTEMIEFLNIDNKDHQRRVAQLEVLFFNKVRIE